MTLGVRGQLLRPPTKLAFVAVVLLGAVGSGASVGLWRLLASQEHAQVASTLDTAAHHFESLLQSRLDSQLKSLTRLARHWERPNATISENRVDALRYLPDSPGLIAVEYLSVDGLTDWSTRDEFQLWPNHGPTLLAAKTQAGALYSPSVTLPSGKRGVLVYCALHDHRGTHNGYLLAVFDLEALLNATTAREFDDWITFELLESGTRIAPSQISQTQTTWTAERRVAAPGLDWTIRVSPNEGLAAHSSSSLPLRALLMGLALTALSCIVLTLALAARARALSLNRASALQHAILEGADHIVVAADMDGTVRSFNPAARRALGYASEDVLGKRNILSLFDPDQLAFLNARFVDQLGPEVTQEATLLNALVLFMEAEGRDWNLMREDGTHLPALVSVSLLRDERGAPQGIVVMAVDQTRRKEEEERFRSLFENSSDAHLLLDETGIVDCNQATLAMIGASSKQELIGHHPSEFSPERQPDGILSREKSIEMDTLARQWGQHRFDWIHTRLSGEDFPVEITLTRVAIRGRPALLIVWHDLTIRMLEEAALRRAKEAAEQATRAKSEFLARMSHDIRTPMNGVLGMVELALRTSLTAAQRDYLDTARTSARSLLRLIDDILDFSRIEAGQLTLENAPFLVRDLLGETIRGFAAPAQGKGLELMYRVDDGVDLELVGDAHRLRQVLVNLLGNAVKFTDSGEVGMRVERESSTDEETVLRFSVWDSGVGVSEEQAGRIFEAFAQADESTSRKYGGSGLGLAICAQLVGLMGGHIWVERNTERGSRFIFTARFVRTRATAALAPAPTDVLGARLLIVEDGPHHRELLRELVEGWRMKPVLAPDAPTAFQRLRDAKSAGEPVDAILLDADLPNSGADALVRALSDDPQLTTRILWLTSVREVDVETRRPYVSKPIVPSHLFETVRALLVGESLEPEVKALVPSPARARTLSVLVADDNAVNRRVASRLLELEGHQVVAVEDGHEAVASTAQRVFDVVLMDVQMPGMDGLAATREIRAREAVEGGHVPIVALTAQAMKGDEERCLAAGMDGYVAKPIDPRVLFSVLGRVVPERAEPPAASASATKEAQSPHLDWAQLRVQVGGSEELLREAAQIFLEDAPRMRASLREGVTRGDPEAVVKSAHHLKGALLSLAAGPASRLAHRLELMGREAQLGDASHLLTQLESELGEVENVLRDAAERA